MLRQLAGRDRHGLGAAAVSAATASLSPRTSTADRVVQSVCPYCAVGCGQLVYVKDEKIVQIEGDPDSPISRGRLCPKGSATRTLSQSPLREYKVKYRRPHATAWEELRPRHGAGHDRGARDRDPRANVGGRATSRGTPLNRTLGIASLGGATLDNEENYLMKKLYHGARRRAGREPGPNLT